MPRLKFLFAVEYFAYASPAGSSDDYSPLRRRLDLLECCDRTRLSYGSQPVFVDLPPTAT